MKKVLYYSMTALICSLFLMFSIRAVIGGFFIKLLLFIAVIYNLWMSREAAKDEWE